ncbi:MAG: hypothetical protein LBM08_09890 [Dysgonamonadaceae bacterium]|jgi:integrase|nr:hypothetical protein [Dysgonamonadaceae bacterium]
MVKLKFITQGKALVLRISENKERFYKSARHLLKGNPNIERHWNAGKERFSSNAISYMENNKILEDFKEIYFSLIKEHPELSAKQVAQYYSASKSADSLPSQMQDTITSRNMNLVEKYLEAVIEREKVKSGCNFEKYYYLLKKCRKLLPGFSFLTFKEINFDKCVSIARIFAKHNGYKDSAKIFRSLLGKAAKDHEINFTLSQIGDFMFADYNPRINEIDHKKPDVLNPEQLKKFLNMDISKVTPDFRNRKRVELYHDFCVFMFHTFFAPCDAIKLRYKDITVQGKIHTKRKKTHKEVEVPVDSVAESIINKYRGKSKDGYVFPIMDDKKSEKYAMKDFIFRQFRKNINCWLKHVSPEIGVDYGLYLYVFRHTAITVALDNGVPISYVAMAAGTSSELIQKHYYNGDNQMNTDRLKMAFMQASE